MLRIIVIAGATLVFAGAVASTGSAAATDPSAASQAALVDLGAPSHAPALVVAKRTGSPTPPRTRPYRTRKDVRGELIGAPEIDASSAAPALVISKRVGSAKPARTRPYRTR